MPCGVLNQRNRSYLLAGQVSPVPATQFESLEDVGEADPVAAPGSVTAGHEIE